MPGERGPAYASAGAAGPSTITRPSAIRSAPTTGGETIPARSADDLLSTYQRIAADVRNLYRIGYIPTPLVRDGAWHQAQVRPAAKDVVVRTRTGDFAPYL